MVWAFGTLWTSESKDLSALLVSENATYCLYEEQPMDLFPLFLNDLVMQWATRFASRAPKLEARVGIEPLGACFREIVAHPETESVRCGIYRHVKVSYGLVWVPVGFATLKWTVCRGVMLARISMQSRAGKLCSRSHRQVLETNPGILFKKSPLKGQPMAWVVLDHEGLIDVITMNPSLHWLDSGPAARQRTV
jgi:hypothetical protein